MVVGRALVPDRGSHRARHVLPSFDAMEGIVRLHRDDAHTFGPQRGRDADDRAGGSNASDEVRDAAARLIPDLRTGPQLVRERIGGIRVLIEIDVAIGLAPRAPLRLADRTVCPFERIGEHERSAKCADDLLALLRHLVGHAELERVPADRADHRQSDAGIPACRIERRFPPKEVALLLRRDDHPQAWPVLHAPAGIGALQLCPDLAARSVPNATQRNERSVADAFQDRPSHALANEGSGEARHSVSLAATLGPDRLQRAPREAERFIAVAARLRGA